MDQMAYWLPLVWAGILGLAIVMYVLLDGFDLGIGMLFLTGTNKQERDQMMNSIAPYWDGNETWLVMGGAGMLVAFPLAYSIILPALYLPILLMLLALVFRGIAFEFRFVSKPNSRLWDRSFAAGSTVATFCQGLVLGGFLQDIKVVDKKFAGGGFEWFTPFSLICGLGLIAGYSLLGATWIMAKTEGDLAERAKRQARIALITTSIFIGIVSLWTPFAFDRIYSRWFEWNRFVYLWPVPLVTAAIFLNTWRSIEKNAGLQAFVSAMCLFVMCFIGLAVSTFPYIVPPVLTIWDSAAVPQSQIFSLVGAVLMLPLIIGYTGFVYWTFRGKVTDVGYH